MSQKEQANDTANAGQKPSQLSSKQKEKEKQNKVKSKNQNKQHEQLPDDGPVKSKAELRAERRALQEAQRAAKAANKVEKQQNGSGKTPAPQSSGATTKTGGMKQVTNKTKQPTNKTKQPTKEANAIRVAYNVQMDDEKVQKKISKKLAKQQVPQRSVKQKKVDLFSHLHQYEKDVSLTKDISFSSDKIHPAIIKLGLQYADGVISGSNARCISLLYALKEVITDYVTPESKELSRDLESKIKPCISFLSQCRHLSVSMGNAIKYLKLQITQIPPEMPEAEAKTQLLQAIDDFIEERIILADKAISNFAFDKIQDGDKILTYGFSSLIINILQNAKKEGKTFQVVVADSRPDFPGKETVTRLVNSGIKCTYCLINALSYIMRDVTTILLGAHALLANGNVMSRAGTAMVAMVAKSNNVPVLVCCETYKFCERVQTDAFVFNELGDPDALVHLNQPNKEDILTGWRNMNSLYLLNLVYDVTPSSLVDMVVTDIGMIPCTSVPVVLRVKSTDS